MSSDNNRYRMLFERSADAILIIDGDRFVDCNQATVEMLRYETKDALLRTHPSELSPEFQPDGRLSFEKANEMMALAASNGNHRFEWDHRRANGEVFPVEVLLTVVPEGDRKLLHVVWRDITERKELEAQLRQAQKMRAIGQLAGGIAHDFNNLLVAIFGHSELIEELTENPEVLANVAEIQRAASRAATLTQQLLAFGRKQVLEPRVVDLNHVVTDLGRMLQRLIGEQVLLETQLSEQAATAHVDPNQIEMAIINLAANARDAMPEGGTLKLGVRVLTNNDAPALAKMPVGDYVCVCVEDNGMGMSQETIARAYEPFFTTKPVGAGTGLGLAMVFGFVRQSDGCLDIESKLGTGTVVSMFVPRTTSAPAADTAPPPTKALGGSEVVLVVEDETSVREMVFTMLSSAGYRVVLASDGVDALEQVTRGAIQHVDLLISDVVMPNMSGPEFAAHFAKLFPRAKVLFSSGHTKDLLSHDGTLISDVNLLRKPYRKKVLLTRVRELLDQVVDSTDEG